jgi:hypothetical protein
MDVIINEYVHENVKILMPNGHYKVYYEPLEIITLTRLVGSIYIDHNLIQNFELRNDREVNSLTRNFASRLGLITADSGHENQAIVGCFDTISNSIILLWNKDPTDHFLCVSYSCNKKHLGLQKINWSKEGF